MGSMQIRPLFKRRALKLGDYRGEAHPLKSEGQKP